MARQHLGHPSLLAGSHLDGSQLLPDGEHTGAGGCCRATAGDRGKFGQKGQFRAAQPLFEPFCWKAKMPTPRLVLDLTAFP